MGKLIKLAHSWLSRVGVRVMQLKNCPRGTDPRLYTDVARRLKQQGHPVVVMDVGANVGDVALDVLDIFPTGTVHAFEPSPSVFGKLQERFAAHAHIRCHQAAMSEVEGVLPFEVREDDTTLSRIATAHSENTVMVPVETVDRVMAQEKLPPLALLKSDTEGHEMEVLRGAVDTLREGRILSILVECSIAKTSSRHVSLDTLETFLTPFGYALFGLYDLGYQRHTGQLRFCNALFKHESVSSQ